MKNIKIFIVVFVTVLSLSSCIDDWLEINPKTDVTRDMLFSVEDGYKDALVGVYVQMKEAALYGENLSVTTVEHLVSSWDVTGNSTQDYIRRFDYSNASVENEFANIFAKLYSTIAGVNSILESLEEDKSVFETDGFYELLKGECLALRAYLHLDVLRLFGPVPAEISTGNLLPYVTFISRTPVPHISYEEFKQLLIKDLDVAESLLYAVDPVVDYSNDELSRPNTAGVNFSPPDDFWAYRMFRMNYYGVKALQARANLWFGNEEAALQAALSVIDALQPDGSKRYWLGKASDMSADDYLLKAEHIFSLHNFRIMDKYQKLFSNGKLKKGANGTVVTTELYGSTGTDIRETYLWGTLALGIGDQAHVIKKYKTDVTAASLVANNDPRRIPMIRLSEMYFIAIETGELANAQSLWNDFLASRNLTELDLPSSADQLRSELLKEYRREFFAEGQAFYAYKRLNATREQILWAPIDATVNYVIPLPATELINQ